MIFSYLAVLNHQRGSLNVLGTEFIKYFSCLTQLDMKFLMLKSTKISRNSSFFAGSDELRMLWFLFIAVKMPTIVGILTSMSRKNFMLS